MAAFNGREKPWRRPHWWHEVDAMRERLWLENEARLQAQEDAEHRERDSDDHREAA